MKKIINTILALSILLIPAISCAQVSINPVYTSERFQPSDKFHAWCENQIDITFSLKNSKINGLNAILKYNPQEIEIRNVSANWEKENNLSYNVNENTITLSKLKSDKSLDSITFSIYLQSKEWIENTSISFENWSYIVNSEWNMVEINKSASFEFVWVPECTPDIVAPSIELLFPSNDTWEYSALDTYFQFKITDQWKWVNKDSIKIIIDELSYDLTNIENERSGDLLTIYPDFWMPFNTWFKVEISVSDKQVYGKANKTTKSYNFQTSNELNLLNEIDPVQFRKLVNKEKYYQASLDECELINAIYNEKTNNWERQLIYSINKRLNCGTLDETPVEIEDEIIPEKNWVSVFAAIWRLLSITFWLIIIFSRFTKEKKQKDNK